MAPHGTARTSSAEEPERAIHSPRIGARLREARRARGMTIAELASAADLSNGFISLLERDETNASVGTLLRVCELLNVRIGSLFERPRTNIVRRAERQAREHVGGRGRDDGELRPAREPHMQHRVGLLEHIGVHGFA